MINYQTTLPVSRESCMQDKKQQLELDIEQQTGSKLRKEYIKAVYCHSALTCVHSTSCEMLGWMTHKVASRNINQPQICNNTILMAESKEELKSFLMSVKEEIEKAGLKLNIQKTKIMESGPIAADAAKLLQSCPTLCDPIDGSPPGSPVPGILQARTLEWVAISFSNA